LFGLDGARPVFVAKANLVTLFVDICLGFAFAKVKGFSGNYVYWRDFGCDIILSEMLSFWLLTAFELGLVISGFTRFTVGVASAVLTCGGYNSLIPGLCIIIFSIFTVWGTTI
jgi:hypothetical protein